MSHTARVQVSHLLQCVCHCCVCPQRLSCSVQDDHCCIQRTGSPSLPWLSLVIAHLLQMPSVHVSSIHGDVHLCSASCRLIPRIPELNEPPWDHILSSDEELQGYQVIRPTAPTTHFTEALFCSRAWSVATAENAHFDFLTTKFPFSNSAQTRV